MTGPIHRSWLVLVPLGVIAVAAGGPQDGSPDAPDAPPPDAPSETAPDGSDKEQMEYDQEQREADQRGVAGFFARSADNITNQVGAGWRELTGFVGADPITELGETWADFNDQLRWTTGLDLGLAYTALYQGATSGRGSTHTGAGDFDFLGSWHLIGEEGSTAGRLGFSTQVRHSFGGDTPRELSGSIGSLVPTVNGFNDHDFELRQLWWQQLAADGRIFLRLGKISQRDLLSTGRFQSDNFFFLNRAFSSSLAVPFPETGAGAVGFVWPTEWLYVAAGIGTADPGDTSTGLDKLFDGELFTGYELGFTTQLDGLGPGTYRFTYSRTDRVDERDQPSGSSIALSFDQQLGKVVPFVRYAYSDREGLAEVRQILTAGVGVFDPLGNQGDVFGLAAAWAEPDLSLLRDEYIIEAFYRIQLTPTLQVTPDFQLIINPSFNTQDDVVGVFGLRVRIQY